MSHSLDETTHDSRKRQHLATDSAYNDDAGDGPIRPAVNPAYLNQHTLERLREALAGQPPSGQEAVAGVWQDAESGARCLATPFPVLQLPRFFSLPEEATSHAFASALQVELAEEPLRHRSNDLFDFHQSWDAQALQGRRMHGLRDVMSSAPVLSIVETVLGVKGLMPGRVDMAAQRYDRGGYLLCHDDDIKEEVESGVARRVAFVYYLVDEMWSAEDGGEYAMFDTVHGQPGRIVHRVLPERGALVMFRVGETSWHQVEEVRTRVAGRARWSVTGWLYGPLDQSNASMSSADRASPASGSMPVPTFAPLTAAAAEAVAAVESPLAQWICDDYLSDEAVARVDERFADESTVQLCGFLRASARDRLARAILQLRTYAGDETSSAWCELGPASLRRYQMLADTCQIQDAATREAAQTLREFDQFMRSVPLAIHLGRLTSLGLGASTRAYGELRRITHGDYTLLRDDWKEPIGLDAVFHLLLKVPFDADTDVSPSAHHWPDADAGEAEWHGAYHYVSAEDGDLLATLTPADNALTLVYRDEGVSRFLKYSLQESGQLERLDALYTYQVDFGDGSDVDMA
ncbi:Oxoglutarate and iron-dependent oxygenase degradation C-term-domain-containing protein [Thamnocephalis sphaerospora]|uniref:Oxoglutarate and iron-dependent oxygenase degradation C-term-domain-containing protein n=1 Tax=Thamnocephalis sphaerospora TaxID=78915 RepID=A0A4V1IXE5_9FUNG|nr:Oxoglutarate and iron-dependent oxygenase degradation C-term-domain-containing protein [Thamnocephalis sphaerospora]|eukprot:RKP10779.1 Oxoglutarate and iron-dependent oxygenase degradation C-term-domain-containing protein [Thamnocephalis sphaerospora]